MATLGELEAGMKAAESELGKYTKDLPSQIQAEVQKAWTPALEGAVGATEQQMAQYVPQFFGIGESLGGSTSADLSPTQKLSQAGTTLGNMVGRLQATQSVADYLGAQMNEMYNRAVTSAQWGQQQAADEYARRFNEYQIAWQEAENAKDRALQLQLQQMSGGGSEGMTEDEKYTELANQMDIARSDRKSGDMSAQQAHDYIMQQAAALGYPMTSEDAWVAIGNTPKAGYTPSLPIFKRMGLGSGMGMGTPTPTKTTSEKDTMTFNRSPYWASNIASGFGAQWDASKKYYGAAWDELMRGHVGKSLSNYWKSSPFYLSNPYTGK